MRTLLLLCLLAVGCTRAGPMEQGARATPDASPPPAEAQAVAAPEKREASTPPPAAAQAAECASDADCALTRVDEDGQCENLCTPRAVPRAQAAPLEAKARAHEAQQPCPQYPCAPPRSTPQAACVEGHCAVRHVHLETQ